MSVSLIIRGPLKKDSLDSIAKYIKDGFDVIVSHWEDGGAPLFRKRVNRYGQSYEEKIPPNLREKLKTIKQIKVVESKYKDIRVEFNFPTFAYIEKNIYQFHSSLRGLELCDTTHAICMRSDNTYRNMVPFRKKMECNPEKFITSNTNFRKDSIFKYHIGSHIVGGRTDNVRKLYKFCIDISKNENGHMDDTISKIMQFAVVKAGKRVVVGEQVMGCGMMLICGEDLSKDNNSIKLVKKHIDIVPIHELGGTYRPQEGGHKFVVSSIDKL